MMKNPLYIFCGGGSRRMGQDKALLMVQGETLLERQIRRSEQMFRKVILLSGSNRYHTTCRILPDAIEDSGPLGGLLAALLDAENQHQQIAVLPVDVPYLSDSTLANLSETTLPTEKDALLVRSGDRIQPLAGVYKTGLAASLESFLDDGQRMVMKFIEGLNTDFLEVQASEMKNFNYPGDVIS